MDYFEELKIKSDACYAGLISPREIFVRAFELLRIFDPKFKLRQDDGKPFKLNFSVPQTLNDSLVVGIRYRKRNGSHREDHFVFTRSEITKFYGNDLEKNAKEYQGTHYKQIGQF